MERKGWDVIRLKYENFANDLDFIFDAIEDHFHISIDVKDKELMRKGYSKENIYRCIQHLTDFREYLPISGFHGQHVIFQEFTPPADFVHWLNIYLNGAKPLFRPYGYF